jgi:hypothetical protein
VIDGDGSDDNIYGYSLSKTLRKVAEDDDIESVDFSPVGAATGPSPKELKPIPDPEVDPAVPEMVPPSTSPINPESLQVGIQ